MISRTAIERAVARCPLNNTTSVQDLSTPSYIYLDTVWPDSPEAVDEHHRAGVGPEGFEPDRDSGDNYLLRCVVRPATASTRMRPIAESELNAGAAACARAATWLITIGAPNA